MITGMLNEKNSQALNYDDRNVPMDINSKEFKELAFHFNTVFNDSSRILSDSKTYEIDKAYLLKNYYLSLNFERREEKEITSYGWFISETSDEKKFEELVYRMRTKGMDTKGMGMDTKIPDINVGPISPSGENDIHDIFICKFIVGESLLVLSNEEFPDLKNEAYDIYDTIIKMEGSGGGTRKYTVRNLENIQLLYLIKIKESETEPQLIKCKNPSCGLKEKIGENQQNQNPKYYYCLLNEAYLCEQCHNNFKTQPNYFMQKDLTVSLGQFNHDKCKEKEFLNLPGECENPLIHHQKKEQIDLFCRDCLKGICSHCHFTNEEQHKDAEEITELFAKSGLKKNNYEEKKRQYDRLVQQLTLSISETQFANNNFSKHLNTFTDKIFKGLFKAEDEEFEHEGKKLIEIAYQLNLIKDILGEYHKYYEEREKFLKENNLFQELIWTKKIHMSHILYIIGLKKRIKSDYKFDETKFQNFIDEEMNKIDKEIEKETGTIEAHDNEKEKEKEQLTIISVLKAAEIKGTKIWDDISTYSKLIKE